MLTNSSKLMHEICITSKLAHRLAKSIVMQGVRYANPLFDIIFKLELEAYLNEARASMQHYEVPEEQIERILRFVGNQAEGEVLIFELRQEFTYHGADQCTLEAALSSDLIRLLQ